MSRTVLLVDDEPDIRQIAGLAMRAGRGWRVLPAADGPEALELAARERPDAVVLDVRMPGMDGPEVLRRLRADEATADIPVVFMTAKAQPRELSNLSSLGVAGVLPKPFDPVGLPGEIAAAFGWD